jgi:hypothetical protein
MFVHQVFRETTAPPALPPPPLSRSLSTELFDVPQEDATEVVEGKQGPGPLDQKFVVGT